MSSQYQLVVQFQATSIDDYDRLVSFEEDLRAALVGFADIDGHDCGSGEFNIFIHTNDPAAIFERVREVVRNRRPEYLMKVAYRDLAGEDYTILWPPDLKAFAIA